MITDISPVYHRFNALNSSKIGIKNAYFLAIFLFFFSKSLINQLKNTIFHQKSNEKIHS